MQKVLVCLQHALTGEQLTSLTEMGLEPVLLKDINPELFAQVANCPGTNVELEELASSFRLECSRYVAVIRPIGSPAFNSLVDWSFGRQLEQAISAVGNPPRMLFAHSERVSVDEPQADGSIKKSTVFKFSHWIEI